MALKYSEVHTNVNVIELKECRRKLIAETILISISHRYVLTIYEDSENTSYCSKK